MPTFTAVGVYEDNGQFWVDAVEADTPADAANKAREEHPELDQILILQGRPEVCWIEDPTYEGPIAPQDPQKGESDG